MKNEKLIPVDQFCKHYEIEFSFINTLKEHGLIEIISIEQTHYLDETKLGPIEKMIRLHYDLDINPEGIDVIFHLLDRIDNLQAELTNLRNQLERRMD
jgi:phage terminase small subunit